MTLPGDIGKRLTVDQYDQMVENGILPETNLLAPAWPRTES